MWSALKFGLAASQQLVQEINVLANFHLLPSAVVFAGFGSVRQWSQEGQRDAAGNRPVPEIHWKPGGTPVFFVVGFFSSQITSCSSKCFASILFISLFFSPLLTLPLFHSPQHRTSPWVTTGDLRVTARCAWPRWTNEPNRTGEPSDWWKDWLETGQGWL